MYERQFVAMSSLQYHITVNLYIYNFLYIKYFKNVFIYKNKKIDKFPLFQNLQQILTIKTNCFTNKKISCKETYN